MSEKTKLTWRDVLDFRGTGTREMAARAAVDAGNTHFCFNDLIYTAGLYPSEGGGVHVDYRETSLTAKDLEPKQAPPRVPPIGQPQMGKRAVQVVRMMEVAICPAGLYETPSDMGRDRPVTVKKEIAFSCGHSCWVSGMSILSNLGVRRSFVPEALSQEETKGLPKTTMHTDALREGIGGIVLCDFCDPVPSYARNADNEPVFVGDELLLHSVGASGAVSEWRRITLLTTVANGVTYAYIAGHTYALPIRGAETRPGANRR